ncbi:hypothetical protein IWQ62_004480 [Dispira parvispora]|uniref:Uncharacterized protein n=1 Tax=Dispira parvispora TaxID=1520584 RepID=A0A9W8AMC2_9FUNG|nr:hypothetical protein IWQ62_004480 [Dispira parvispora]
MQGPLGSIINVICPSLGNPPGSSDLKDSLSKLDDEEFSSLFSWEMSAFKAYIQDIYHYSLSESVRNRRQELRVLAGGYHPVLSTSIPAHQDTVHSQHPKALAEDNFPSPAKCKVIHGVLQNGLLIFPDKMFVRPIPSPYLKLKPISPTDIDNAQLLRISPSLFLGKHLYFTERGVLINEFERRVNTQQFRETVRRTMGDFAEHYALYFQEDPIQVDHYEYIFQHNLSKAMKVVFSTLLNMFMLDMYDMEKLRVYIEYLLECEPNDKGFDSLMAVQLTYPPGVQDTVRKLIEMASKTLSLQKTLGVRFREEKWC